MPRSRSSNRRTGRSAMRRCKATASSAPPVTCASIGATARHAVSRPRRPHHSRRARPTMGQHGRRPSSPPSSARAAISSVPTASRSTAAAREHLRGVEGEPGGFAWSPVSGLSHAGPTAPVARYPRRGDGAIRRHDHAHSRSTTVPARRRHPSAARSRTRAWAIASPRTSPHGSSSGWRSSTCTDTSCAAAPRSATSDAR